LIINLHIAEVTVILFEVESYILCSTYHF